MKSEEVLERLNLAILANGGENFRQEWCECDPSVGQVPCTYCAIHTGLKVAKERILKLDEEIRVSEVLLTHRDELLNAIPPCPVHGPCVPHAIDWVEQAKLLMEMRPELQWFAREMESELRWNDHKGTSDWHLCDFDYLYRHLMEKAVDLNNMWLVGQPVVEGINQAIKIGNYAMMIGDKLRSVNVPQLQRKVAAPGGVPEFGRRCQKCNRRGEENFARMYYKPIDGRWRRLCKPCWEAAEATAIKETVTASCTSISDGCQVEVPIAATFSDPQGECPKGGEHQWYGAGHHANQYCSKCGTPRG